MPSLNFQKQFAGLIESGKKRQTICPIRKNPVKVGDPLYLFSGLRTKYCKRLNIIHSVVAGSDRKNNLYVKCKSVDDIRINEYYASLNGKELKYDEVLKIAVADGFNSERDSINFFKNNYGFPFEGVLIKW